MGIFRLPYLEHDMSLVLPYSLKPYEKAQAKRYLDALEALLYVRLTRAGKRIFQTAWTLAQAKRVFTRHDLGLALGRVGGLLQPYDVRLLKQIVQWGLLEESKRARPLRGSMPTGYEYVYRLPVNVRWGCKYIAQRRKKAH